MISAFTIIKNACMYEYPIVESVKSLLPYVDEYIVNAGDSDDETDKLLEVFKDNPKVKIFKSVWEGKDQGMAFFRNQTNLALDKCKGDWCFYLQADEAILEEDAERIKSFLDPGIDAVVFRFLHFSGDYRHILKDYTEGCDAYTHAVRLIRNNGRIKSVGDAMDFGGIERAIISDMKILHYGYVRSPKIMLSKKLYLKDFYFQDPTFTDAQKQLENGKIRSKGDEYVFSRAVNVYEGKHPKSMEALIHEPL